MIVFLTEERSMQVLLRGLLARAYPEQLEGVDWQVFAFQGKADLEKQFPRKMRDYTYNSPHFIILRDNDGAACQQLKAHLHQIASATGKPFHIRLVCQQLESWLLGDLPALESAYPSTQATRLSGRAKFRNPDKLNNASEELHKLTGISSKVAKSEAITPFLDPRTNTSDSFLLTFRTIQEFLG